MKNPRKNMQEDIELEKYMEKEIEIFQNEYKHAQPFLTI